MKIPQSMQELRRMSPTDQRQVGEIFGRLMALDPTHLTQITKIAPQELQALMPQAQNAQPGQPAPAGASIIPGAAPGASPTPQSPPAGPTGRGTYGVLQEMASPKGGLTMRDSATGASRPVQPGEQPGPTEILMHGSDILQMGPRAHASLRMQAKGAQEARI